MDTFVQTISDFLYTAQNTLLSIIGSIGIFDIIDIAILTFLIYKVIDFCLESRARTLLKGIALVILMYALSVWLGMTGINWILEKVVNYGLVILALIFQPELRRALEKVGHSSFGILDRNNSDIDITMLNCIDSVCKAAITMSEQKTGALIVFENKTPLGEVVNTGTVLDAEASMPMICNVFFPKSPLHDGAMVIKEGRIEAAGCILPLTTNSDIGQELGTRHRAAIGISENSDAVTVVVSEESGIISLTRNGTITRNFNAQSLRQELQNIFAGEKEVKKNPIRQFVGKIFKNGGDKNG